jgi:uncharacterized membrane-anchored protein
MADFATRSMGIGYPGGALVLLAAVLASLLVWRQVLGTVSVSSVHEPRAEVFYWLTITFSQTLGTALGDWIADGPLGYLGSAVIFGSLLVLIALAWFRTSIDRVALFWAAFILTRPLGAVVGDFLDKPYAQGGLELSRVGATLVLGSARSSALLLLVRQTRGARGSATGVKAEGSACASHPSASIRMSLARAGGVEHNVQIRRT